MYQQCMSINKEYCNNDSNDIYEQCLELLSAQPRAGNCRVDSSSAAVLQPAQASVKDHHHCSGQ